MLDAIGVASRRRAVRRQIPAGVRLGRAARPAGGMPEQEVYAHLRELARAQRLGRGRDHVPRRGDVRPLRPGADRHAHRALGVPDAVHALPARGLPGRPAGDVRVPDGDQRADRAAGLQRVGLRGPERGRRRRLPGQAGQRPRRGSSSRPACTRTRSRRCAPTRAGYGVEVVEVPLRDGVTDPDAWAEAIDDDTGAVFLQQPNFLGAVEDVAALAGAAPRTRARVVVVGSYDPITLGVLEPPGRVRRRRLRRRGPAARQPARLRRAVVRLLRRHRGATCAACPAASPARPSTSTAAAASC